VFPASRPSSRRGSCWADRPARRSDRLDQPRPQSRDKGRTQAKARAVARPTAEAHAGVAIIRPPNKGLFIECFGHRPLGLYGIWLRSSLTLGSFAMFSALISAGLLLWRSF
jgi:hypothetical protein